MEDWDEPSTSAPVTSSLLAVAIFLETERNLTKPNETERLLSSNVLQKCIK